MTKTSPVTWPSVAAVPRKNPCSRLGRTYIGHGTRETRFWFQSENWPL